MWTLLITKKFIKQLVLLKKDDRGFVNSSLDYLLKVVDHEQPFDVQVIDEDQINGDAPQEMPFPITFTIDYQLEKIFLISIESNWDPQKKQKTLHDV